MTTPISKQRLLEYLFSQGFADASAPDKSYALPSLEWLAADFAEALAEDLDVNGLRYVTARWNCTKFTRHAADIAAQCWLETPADGLTRSASLAFGTFDFIRPDDTGHSVNIAVTRDAAESLRLAFFEPQTQSLIPQPPTKGTPCIRF